jgi:tetratricopeptide (TPR) repeat protein
MMIKRALLATLFLCSAASAKRALTLQEAISDAEAALDNGRVGDAIQTSERLLKTRGLTKEEQARVDVIVARCKLVEGQYGQSEKLFARRVKAAPDDPRLSEWYARALDGNGKGDEAFTLLKDLARKDALAEGDSYWVLARLERKKGENQEARAHAKLALEKPIVLQSDELEQAIHKFIDELSGAKGSGK